MTASTCKRHAAPHATLLFTLIGLLAAHVPGSHSAPATRLRGSVLVDGVIAVLPCGVGIQPSDPNAFEGFGPLSEWGGSTDGTWWSTWIEDGGEFGWHGLAPGKYNVRLMGKGSDDPIDSWNDVQVNPSELTLDLRMQNVDLRSDFRWLELEVVDPHGDPIEAASWGLATPGPGFNDTKPLADSANGFYLPSSVRSLQVCAPGFLDATLIAEGKLQRVTLNRAPQVTLVLASTLKLPKSAYFTVAIQPLIGPKHTALAGQVGTRLISGDVELSVARLGENRVVLVLYFQGVSGPRRIQLPLPDGAAQIEIVGTLEGQRFEVPVTQALIDQALAE